MGTETSDALRKSEGNGREAAGDDSGLPCKGHLKKLLDCHSLRVVPPQHLIFSQGEYPHTVCLICSGMVKLSRTELDGTRFIIGLRQKGWMMGAVSAFLDMPYESTAETVIRSKLCFLSTERLKREMEDNAELSRWVRTLLSQGLRASMINIAEQACLSGRQRLANFLWKLIQARNGFDSKKPLKIQMFLKNWEVAQALALTPQHLCRLVKQMENEGLIARRKGWLILPDPDRFRPEMVGQRGVW